MAEPKAPRTLRTETNLAANWTIFRSEFQHYVKSLNTTETPLSSQQQVAILRHVIGANGLALIDQLHIGESHAGDIEAVLNALEATCCSTDPPNESSRKEALQKFNTRVQMPHESFEDFFTDIYRLSLSCGFGVHQNEMLRDRIVDGVAETNTKKQLLKMTDLTLANALGLCRMADMLRSRSTDTINGTVIVAPSGRDVSLQNSQSTECVLQKGEADRVKAKKEKVEVITCSNFFCMCYIYWYGNRRKSTIHFSHVPYTEVLHPVHANIPISDNHKKKQIVLRRTH